MTKRFGIIPRTYFPAFGNDIMLERSDEADLFKSISSSDLSLDQRSIFQCILILVVNNVREKNTSSHPPSWTYIDPHPTIVYFLLPAD